LELSVGSAVVAPDDERFLDALVAEADRAMYEHKRARTRTASR
jgi:hypothetical protein